MLLDELAENFIMLDRTTAEDGYGGITTVWSEGATFQATISVDTSIEAQLAGKQGVTGIYTIITNKAVTLRYHDVIRRVSDGKVFRITSNGDDSKTPPSAWLDARKVTAEEWELPNG